MAKTADKIAAEIRHLPDIEKLRLVDAILVDLENPDREIERVWAEKACKRWATYKAGRVPTILQVGQGQTPRKVKFDLGDMVENLFSISGTA